MSVEVALTATSSTVLAGVGAGGTLTQTVRHYLPGQGCGVALTRLEMIAQGYWTDVGPRTMARPCVAASASVLISKWDSCNAPSQT